MALALRLDLGDGRVDLLELGIAIRRAVGDRLLRHGGLQWSADGTLTSARQKGTL